ncbi:hypothetical protein K2173_023398 [Erythroxylum novogranatense]|uniref:DUF4378 domain-containing protein n=1 Tax=Erythroxylum novogranatense TaxID=1862640 RepID=A0AAV8TW18_9ROSI|nr:hypothetical protein K2173_023398 [Erythroxylum novogranatense]
MGGLFQLFNLNQSTMARKILPHKRHVDGLEAPRNSMELQVETSQHCLDAGNSLYSCQVEEDCSERNCYPIELSMKKLINEEISKQHNTRKNAPSIVARLMGVDMLPLDTKSVVKPPDKKSERTKSNISKKDKNEVVLSKNFPSKSKSSRKMNFDLYTGEIRGADRWNDSQMLGKPRPREHPQEEELKKFKKEFEAWQASRFKECSKFVEIGSISDHFPVQRNINKPKVVNCSYSGQPVKQKSLEHKGFETKANSIEKFGLQRHKHKRKLFPTEQKELLSSRMHSLNYDQRLDSSSAPTRIVILKPGPYRIYDYEESWTNSSGDLEDRVSMEEFLEEVKDQLRLELQGKTLKRGSVVRGSGIETPFRERPSDPKQIAQHIAKQVRESASHEHGMNLLRSESTRSCRSEIQFNACNSPEFINRDTRRFLSERLRNVLKREAHLDAPVIISSSSRSFPIDNELHRLKQVGEVSKNRNEQAYWEIKEDEQEIQTRSFRHEDGDSLLHRDLSPRNLIRSLSAPVSGTSFGKLLLEDRHVLTGAHIRRKHESLDNVTFDMKNLKKEKFNIKEKVSNFKYNLSLRGRLFGKKMESIVESHGFEQDIVKDIMSGPTVTRNLGHRAIMENSTEVPPSPASVCNSPQEEFWRPADDISPASTPDLREDGSLPQVFREISCNLNELRRQLNQLESDGVEDATTTHEPVELMVDLDNKAEAYIRDLFVTSGLYDGSYDQCLSKWDPSGKPISNSVFEEVKESYRKQAEDREFTLDKSEKVDHKMLFDLLNETLPTVLGPPITMSRFRRKIIGMSMLPPLRGKKLLDRTWEIICEYIYPSNDKSYYSLDSLEARNLESSPWSTLMDDEANAYGKEIECLIMGDIIEETVKEMLQ